MGRKRLDPAEKKVRVVLWVAPADLALIEKKYGTLSKCFEWVAKLVLKSQEAKRGPSS